MRKAILGFAVCGVLSASPAFGAVIQLAGVGPRLAVERVGATGKQLTVTVPEARIEGITIRGRRWAVVTVPGGHSFMTRGSPALPFLTTDYLLGDSERVAFRIAGVKERIVDLNALGYAGVAPSKGHFTRNIDPATVPWTFNPAVYAGTASYPLQRIFAARPYIAGPLRGQGLRMPVARWIPSTNQLILLEEARFEITEERDRVNARLTSRPGLTALFDPVARTTAVNYGDIRKTYAPDVVPGRLVILAADSLLNAVRPLADWETKVGYPTTLTPLSSVGKTPAEIHAYLKRLYDSPEKLSWILLVGDYEQIPNFAGVNERAPCDACYTKLEGNDNRPDASIARISAKTTAQVTAQVDKILRYERNPEQGGSWYSRGMGIASDQGQPADRERMGALRTDLLKYNYTEFAEFYDGSHDPTPADVARTVENGIGLGLYIGHGSETSWVTSDFSADDAKNLKNPTALPVIWDVACLNGAFHEASGDCFAEAWMKNPGGGSVSFEAATTSEAWVPPLVAQRGIVDALRLEQAFTTGAQHMRGKFAVMTAYGDTDKSEGTMWVEQSTLFGSPVLWPRSTEPGIVDRPTGFSMEGTTATLTLKAKGAIVSFLGADGQVVGSGVTAQPAGKVRAKLNGIPSSVHVHGCNLVPAEFDL